MNDTQLIDWLEGMQTLHGTLEFLYVVDGYRVDVLFDGRVLAMFEEKTLREAMQKAAEKFPKGLTRGNIVATLNSL